MEKKPLQVSLVHGKQNVQAELFHSEGTDSRYRGLLHRHSPQNIYYLVGKTDRVEAFPAALACLRDGASLEELMAEVMVEQPGASGHEFAPLNLTVVGSEILGAVGAASYSCRNKSRHRQDSSWVIVGKNKETTGQ